MKMEFGFFLMIAIPIVVIILYIAYRRKFKKLRIPCVCLVTGAPKSGKDLLCADNAPSKFKAIHFVWKWLRCPIAKLMKRPLPEEPLFYVNQPFSFGSLDKALNKNKPHRLDRCIRYVTYNMLHRNERPAYKSVVFMSELTLVADSMLSKTSRDKDSLVTEVTNIELTLFCKLFGHMTRGGYLYCNTQNVQDVHYAFKRVASTFLFVHSCTNVPFFHVLRVREMVSSDNDAVNSVTSDVDNDLKIYLVPKWHHNRYNRYFLSYLTDELPVSDSKEYPKEIVTFNEKYIMYGDKRIKKDDIKKGDTK